MATAASIAIAAVIVVLLLLAPIQADNYSYWSAWRVGLYHLAWPAALTYVYPPPFAQLIWPLTLLPFAAFTVLWTLALTGALLLVVGARWIGWALLLLPFVVKDVGEGQIHALLALAILVGFRWPAAWSFLLLTKVTPGIGLLWFAVRGEWRALSIALGATAAIAGVSFLLAPDLWGAWVGTVGPALRAPNPWSAYSVPVLMAMPLAARLAMAAAIVALGGRTNQRWTVPLASFLALPGMWVGGLTILLAIVPLVSQTRLQRLPESVQRTAPQPGREDHQLVEVEG